MRGLELATTPLAHPTGVDMIDGLTSPLGIASLAAGGAGIARAVAGGGAAAGAEAAGGMVAAQVKYWLTKAALMKMGVPPILAEGAAAAVSGYKKGAKPPVAAEVTPAGVETAQDALARRVATAGSVAPPAAPIAPPAPPNAVPGRIEALPPTAGSAPSAPTMGPDGLLVGRPGGNPALPDQKALNEAALAARRSVATAPLSAAKPSLLASETTEYLRLLKAGKTHAEAMKAVQLQRDLISTLGTPSDADARTAIAARQYK